MSRTRTILPTRTATPQRLADLATSAEAPSAEAARAELDAFERGHRGQKFTKRRGRLARSPGPRDPAVRVSAGAAQDDLHDQRHREHQRQASQDHQDARKAA